MHTETTTADLTALLGAEAVESLLATRGTDGLTDLLRAVQHIDGDAGEDDDTLEAVNGALLAALGDESVASLARHLATARRAVMDATERLRGAVVWERTASGAREADLVRAAGVSRDTVRRWIGASACNKENL